jgi:inner membrane protein
VESFAGAIRRVLASPGFKFFLICGLIVLLLIPLLLVWALIMEREQRAAGVGHEVGRAWGD